MWKPEIGICTGCERERLILTKCRYLCSICESKRKPQVKKKTGHRQSSGDQIFYRHVWQQRALKHNTCACEECGKALPEYSSKYISHIISRGANTKLRHNTKNVVIMCMDCHQKWEFGDRKSMKVYPVLEYIKEELTREYYQR